MPPPSPGPPTLYTIGHSNHTEERFLELLQQHRIDVLVDVRSTPYSQYNPQFNDRNLKHAVETVSVRYLFMGDSLGGRPPEEDFFDEAGHVLYHKLAESSRFLAGIERLERGVREHRVAIMCSEEDPAVCHRHLLVTRVAGARGMHILHIRGDGRLESEEHVSPPQQQGMLFTEMERDAWKSLRSVLPKPQPPNSSPS